jgi:hypothetical protein
MLSEERREEIWEQVADELYNKNFEFSDLEMECEAEQEDPRWGMPMYMSGGYTNKVTVKYTFDPGRACRALRRRRPGESYN